jgi:putative phosphoribosyl transferase
MPLFEDRVKAAEQLARRVQEWLDSKKTEIDRHKLERQEQKSKNNDNVIVLAIPRGGVVIGDIVSNILGAKLDIVVSRKIGAPYNPELAIGAVMPDGSYFLNQDIVNVLNVPKYYIHEQADVQKKEIKRRLQIYRGMSAKGSEVRQEQEEEEEEEENSDYYNNFEGKTVLLVDDGIATGATILSAAQWLKTKKNCCKILIVAVPVAPPPPSIPSSSNEDIVSKLNQIADKVIILYRPDPFYSVGQFYRHFEQVNDAQVKEIMKRHGYKPL